MQKKDIKDVIVVEDRLIIDLLFQRDEKALEELAEKYGKLVFRISQNILSNREDARECVNDTYLAVWNRIPPENPSPLSAFICKIARNLSLKKLRFQNAQKRKGTAVPIEELENLLSAENLDVHIDSRLLGKKLNSFLETLEEEARVVFVKRYWFCDSIDEIAKATALSESNIYTKLSRTRSKLLAYLKKEGVFYE